MNHAEFTNALGEVRYQPMSKWGTRLWTGSLGYEWLTLEEWDTLRKERGFIFAADAEYPVLYKSAKRADKVARRYEARILREAAKDYEKRQRAFQPRRDEQ